MKGFGNIENAVDDVLDVYCHQCAIAMSCRDLARAGLYLSNGGQDPATGAEIVSPLRARRINAIMLTCGHYDAAGEFAFRVGLPGKSGVGGGILAVVPRGMAVAVWSPGLNEHGNSAGGHLVALEALVTIRPHRLKDWPSVPCKNSHPAGSAEADTATRRHMSVRVISLVQMARMRKNAH